MLYQMSVEGVVVEQSSGECSCIDIITTVINQCHLALEIINVALQGVSLSHLDYKEMVDVLLELLPRGELV